MESGKSSNLEGFEKLVYEQLKSAYRKYKTDVYYNKFSAIQRAELAEFEINKFCNAEGVVNEDCANNYFEKITKRLLNDQDLFFEELLSKIGIMAFPKKMKDIKVKNCEESKTIISNFSKESFDVERLYYFISLPVEAHILGILWILREGYILDDVLYKNCYGNRINKLVLEKIKKGEVKGEYYSEFNTFLFEPYFEKYQSWRDKGLTNAEKLIEENHDAIIFSIDLKDYYYRSKINFKNLSNALSCGRKRIYGENQQLDVKSSELNNSLTFFIKQIFKKYSDFFVMKSEHNPSPNYQLPMIPLGFAPSLIISNWYLLGFDKAILEDLHPSYYGRYVDDILIVLPSHNKSESFGPQFIENLPPKDIFKKYLSHKDNDLLNSIFSPIKKNYFLHNKKLTLYCDKHNSTNEGKIDFFYENLRIQSDKLKFFIFSHNHSKALIDKFKREIYENSSEFRLMPDTKKLYDDFGADVYSMKYSDSINKLRDIKDFEVSKFQLSKKLSQLIRDSLYETDKKPVTIIKEIISSFDGNTFDFLILWEQFFTYLYINDKLSEFIEQLKKFISYIDNLNCEEDYLQKNDFNYNKNNDKLLKKTLFKYLYYVCTRVLSIKQMKKGINLDKFFNKRYIKSYSISDIFDLGTFDNLNHRKEIRNYVSSALINNLLMKNPLSNLDFIYPKLINNINNENEIEEYNLLDTKDRFFDKEKYNLENNNLPTSSFYNGFCYPRYINFHECTLHSINYIIYNSSNNVVLNSDKYLKWSLGLYNKLNYGIPFESEESHRNNNSFFVDKCNFDCENNGEKCHLLKNNHFVKTPYKENVNKIKVGLANINFTNELVEKRLYKHPNLSYKRLELLRNIVNDAIKKQVDILIMPEVYVPYEWVEHLVEASRKKQMAIIFGIEYLINNFQDKEYIGNYIGMALPSVDEQSKHYNCTLAIRLKNHYSPHELNTFKNFDLRPIENENNESKYILCVWRDIHIIPYCCYEIADIHDRSIFKSCADIITVSEFNKDTLYFNNIVESLSRDLFCYCIKSNTSKYGGSSIIQPSDTANRYLLQLKGGDDDYIVTHELNISRLRKRQCKHYTYVDDDYLKPKPPGFDDNIVKKKNKC